MNFLADIYGYGYMPSVLFLMNTIIVCTMYSKHIERRDYVIVFATIVAGIIMSVKIITLIPWNNYLDLWAAPSLSEGFMNFCSIAAFSFVLRRTDVNSNFKNIFWVLTLLSVPLFFLPIFYPLFFDAALLISFFIMMAKINTKKIRFVLSYLGSLIIVNTLIFNLSWAAIGFDFRPDKLTFVKENKGFDDCKTQNYMFGCINDTENRLKMVIDEINRTDKDCIEFVFLEDTIPAFSFLRSTLIVSPFGVDPLDYGKANPLTILKKDCHFYKPVGYKTSKTFDYNLILQSDTSIVVSGGFDELNFAVLCSFQRYLESSSHDYISKSIVLENNLHKQVLKMHYYDKDMYDIEL